MGERKGGRKEKYREDDKKVKDNKLKQEIGIGNRRGKSTERKADN